MADERSKPPFNKTSGIPSRFSRAKLIKLRGDPLDTQYRKTLEGLGKEPGMLGILFRKAQNKIQIPLPTCAA